MATGYNYSSFVQALRINAVVNSADANFTTMIPSIISYASQRIMRELDLISTVTTDDSTTATIGDRNLSIPTDFVVVNDVAVIVGGSRQPLTPVSIAVVNQLWPGNLTQGVPEVYAMVDQWSMILGPSPDDAYVVEVVGTQRPDDLSETNPTTFLSERLPDLFMAAAMTFTGLYQRNFTSAGGSQGNDPMMAANWESQYQLLKASADVEELRKHFAAASWTSRPISSQAQPQRG